MEATKIIKLIDPDKKCPHCGEDIYVSVKMLAPQVDWVLQPAAIQGAKAQVIKEVSEKMPDGPGKDHTLEWLRSEDCVFGPDEVSEVINQLMPDDTPKEDTTEKLSLTPEDGDKVQG